MSRRLRAVIEAYFRGQETMRSPAAGCLAVAQLGTIVQSGRDPEGSLLRWDPLPMRRCSPQHLAVLRAYYWPTEPRTQWETHEIVLGGEVWRDGTGQVRTEVIQVRRDSYDWEVRDDLGLPSCEEARRLRREAEDLVLAALDAGEREP